MSEPALVVRARRLRAARGVVVARDVVLTAAPGNVVAVEGPNGSGKSTHPATLQTPVAGPAAWLYLPGLALVAVAAFLAARLT